MASLYQALPQGSTRLLEHIPSNEENNLRFRFINTSSDALEPEHAYTAISYTWGLNAASETIYIDDQPVVVKPHVWACLYNLTVNWTYIWLDAICINQENITERNQQALMMDSIYRNAEVVSVWLGSPNRDDCDCQVSVDAVANHPYWTRCWIISEFLLAKELNIYYGNQQVDDFLIETLVSDASRDDVREALNEDSDTSEDFIERRRFRTQRAREQKWRALSRAKLRYYERPPDEPGPSLFDLIAENSDTQSTDPRDKVFAMLGLLPSVERHLIHRSFPNYGLPLEEVHIITLAHLRFTGGHRPLRPILKAFGISSINTEKVEQYFKVVDALDYENSRDLVQDVRTIMANQAALSSGTDIERQPLLRTRRSSSMVVTAMSTLDNPFYQPQSPLELLQPSHKKRFLLYAAVFAIIVVTFGILALIFYKMSTGHWKYKCKYYGSPDSYSWHSHCRFKPWPEDPGNDQSELSN